MERNGNQPMTMTEYQQMAWRTVPQMGYREMRIMSALGLVGETGEYVEMLKKMLYHGHTIPTLRIAEELGDILWYVAAVASAWGLSLDVVARANIAKLRQRYPERFDDKLSQNRNGQAELEALIRILEPGDDLDDEHNVEV